MPHDLTSNQRKHGGARHLPTGRRAGLGVLGQEGRVWACESAGAAVHSDCPGPLFPPPLPSCLTGTYCPKAVLRGVDRAPLSHCGHKRAYVGAHTYVCVVPVYRHDPCTVTYARTHTHGPTQPLAQCPGRRWGSDLRRQVEGTGQGPPASLVPVR